MKKKILLILLVFVILCTFIACDPDMGHSKLLHIYVSSVEGEKVTIAFLNYNPYSGKWIIGIPQETEMNNFATTPEKGHSYVYAYNQNFNGALLFECTCNHKIETGKVRFTIDGEKFEMPANSVWSDMANSEYAKDHVFGTWGGSPFYMKVDGKFLKLEGNDVATTDAILSGAAYYTES